MVFIRGKPESSKWHQTKAWNISLYILDCLGWTRVVRIENWSGDAPEKLSVFVQSVIWLQPLPTEEAEQDEIQAHYCTSVLQQNQSEYASLPRPSLKRSAGSPGALSRGGSHSVVGLMCSQPDDVFWKRAFDVSWRNCFSNHSYLLFSIT